MRNNKKIWQNITKCIFTAILTMCLIIPYTELSLYAKNIFAPATESYETAVAEIWTVDDLYGINGDMSGSYVLMADIDISAFGDGEWTPIGYDANEPFTGVFDGQGHVIRNLKVTAAYEFTVLVREIIGQETALLSGLFGKVSGAFIKNVGLEDVCISVSSSANFPLFAGGICGYLSDGNIDNCYSSGIVEVVSQNRFVGAGGISGTNVGVVTISNSINACDVSASSFASLSGAGGISGFSFSGSHAITVNACHNLGSIKSSVITGNGVVYAGGVYGSFDGTINDCSNMGSVNAEGRYAAYAGGLCGDMEDGSIIGNGYNIGVVSAISEGSNAYAGGILGLISESKASNCYNVGNVAANAGMQAQAFAGGLYGYFIDSSMLCGYSAGNIAASGNSTYIGGISGVAGGSYSISNCYWNIDNDQTANNVLRPNNAKRYIGNINNGNFSRTTLQMKDSANYAANYQGFDFEATWCFIEGDNDGYPVLRAFYGCIDHEYEWVVTVEATCEDEGEESFVCAICGDVTITRPIPPTGHDYKAIYTDPVCGANGFWTYTCALCGNSYTVLDAGSALGHNWDNGAVTTEPTCDADGIKTFTCQRCSDTRTEPIGKLEHIYDDAYTAPTCTKDGFTTYTCVLCGNSYTVVDVGSALGHNWDNGAITKQPTCDADGVKTFTCQRCGDTRTEPIGKLTHIYDDAYTAPTCTKDGFTTYTCALCGNSYTVVDAGSALGHNWDNGAVTKQPTSTEEGIKTFTCTVCGETRTEPIPKLQDSYGILVADIVPGNGQSNINFGIRSANGKGYYIYISESGIIGTFVNYTNVNFNAQGAHIKGLTNGKLYYIYVEYNDGKTIERSAVVEVVANK